MPVPIGHMWLRQELGLAVPTPAVESYVVSGPRQREVRDGRTIEYFPVQYQPANTVVAHLRFALRHEPTSLDLLVAALNVIDPRELESWVRREPTGAFSRRSWFLFETFAGRGTLDVEDARTGNYVEALDPSRHIVSRRRNSQRHRVADNMLGGPGLCPTVRLTPYLKEQMGLALDQEARRLVGAYDPVTLARAVSYLYTKETRSSFAIEGETPSPRRAERFVALLRDAATFDPTSRAALVSLQNAIVDPRYAATTWRDFQNFVGETRFYAEEVHFICPKPDDVDDLMRGWFSLVGRVLHDVDPVVVAAVAAFAFVFIHPFEDGNGRIHRFLMHYVLSTASFSPPGIIFPISAAILRDRRSYDAVLESFSKPLLQLIDWRWTDQKEVRVEGSTVDLYRYFDATAFAEYLYGRVSDTIRTDLREELHFVAVFDRAFEAVREIVDMPDRRASLFVRLCMQERGRLSKAKRDQFPEITDDEIAAMEHEVATAIQAEEPGGA